MGRFIQELLPPGAILKSEQWFYYIDENGRNYCQPDHFVVLPTHVLLVECKLTQKSRAFPQMGGLYVPVLQHIYKRPIVGVQVCRNMQFRPEKYMVEDFCTLFTYTPPERMFTYHAFNI